MQRLQPEKLHVYFLPGTSPEILKLPRRYTLTHSDRTGDIHLTIGPEWDKEQISGWYTRCLRDEILGEILNNGEKPVLKIHCHVSGGMALGTARWRYGIFRRELSLVLEAIREGDGILFQENPGLDDMPVTISFHAHKKQYNREEAWGTIGQYR
jgi:hypothetical protein